MVVRAKFVSVRRNFQLPTTVIQVIPQLDVRESCQAAPQHSVAWRAVVASVEITAEPGEDIANGSPVRIVRRRHQPVQQRDLHFGEYQSHGELRIRAVQHRKPLESSLCGRVASSM